MYKSDHVNCVLGRDFKHTPYPHPCCLSIMLITHKFFNMWQEGDFISSILLALMAPCCFSPVFKSGCVTGRILNVEEFMLAFMAKYTLKHLVWVTGIF